MLIAVNPAVADDVGITKARLIQKSEKSYVVEADVTQVLAWAIKAPIFPDRFQVSELEFITQSGWIVVQATATTTGEPLSAHDGILLPWMRNGAVITVQWLDGSVYQGLFLRSLEGIRVPVRLLMPSAQTLSEVCRDHFVNGLKHFRFTWIHLLLVLAVTLLLPSRQVFKGLLYYTFGQVFSLILADVGLTGFDLIFIDILGTILIFLLAHAAVRQKPINQYLFLISLFGLMHGLSYAHELSSPGIEWNYKLPALFMFNFAIDACQYLTAIIVILIAKALGAVTSWKKEASYAIGAFSVALLLLMFQEHVITGKTDVLDPNSTRLATRFSLPVSQQSQPGGPRPSGVRRLTDPLMSYLSVTPYEVRQEILIQARAAVQFLGVDDTGKGSIPVKSLEPVKNGIIEVVQKANSILIDRQPAKSILARADFVSLGSAGVMVRSEPIVESLDNGVIGLTLVYETANLPDEITINWKLFSQTVKKVKATMTDPFGGATKILSPGDNILKWRSRLSGYRVPVIEKVVVLRPKIPVVSLFLFLVALVLAPFLLRRPKFILGRAVLVGVVALGFALYPFISIPVNLPWVSQWKPSTERTAIILNGLLTNVYRAFDVRDENRVYDRLSMSVIGNQLSQIYLQNRKSLELENRGGARANVDAVDILSIIGVEKSADDGFVADAIWTVSGSVSHFGHTHYRRNRNHALVTFVIDEDSWKIKDIELIDEERLF